MIQDKVYTSEQFKLVMGNAMIMHSLGHPIALDEKRFPEGAHGPGNELMAPAIARRIEPLMIRGTKDST